MVPSEKYKSTQNIIHESNVRSGLCQECEQNFRKHSCPHPHTHTINVNGGNCGGFTLLPLQTNCHFYWSTLPYQQHSLHSFVSVFTSLILSGKTFGNILTECQCQPTKRLTMLSMHLKPIAKIYLQPAISVNILEDWLLDL